MKESEINQCIFKQRAKKTKLLYEGKNILKVCNQKHMITY